MGWRDLHAGIATRKFPGAEGADFFLAFWLTTFLSGFLVILWTIFYDFLPPNTTRMQVNVTWDILHPRLTLTLFLPR